MIKTISYDQHDIIADIQALHCPEGFEVDPTYSSGKFYDDPRIIEPKFRSDLIPKYDYVEKHDAKSLPFEDGTVASIMFDPPFLAGYTKDKPTGVIGERFHGFRYIPDLWDWYVECLMEFHRILKPGGVLVFKCQDTVSSGKQWFSHCEIYNWATAGGGFIPKDLFILLAKNRMIGHNHANQKHARKFHSYFWVFEKGK